MDFIKNYHYVIDGQKGEVEAGVKSALDSGLEPGVLLKEALIGT
jgi:hypothetical protein